MNEASPDPDPALAPASGVDSTRAAPAAPKRRPGMILAGLGAIVVLVGAGIAWLQTHENSSPRTERVSPEAREDLTREPTTVEAAAEPPPPEPLEARRVPAAQQEAEIAARPVEPEVEMPEPTAVPISPIRVKTYAIGSNDGTGAPLPDPDGPDAAALEHQVERAANGEPLVPIRVRTVAVDGPSLAPAVEPQRPGEGSQGVQAGPVPVTPAAAPVPAADAVPATLPLPARLPRPRPRL